MASNNTTADDRSADPSRPRPDKPDPPGPPDGRGRVPPNPTDAEITRAAAGLYAVNDWSRFAGAERSLTQWLAAGDAGLRERVIARLPWALIAERLATQVAARVPFH